MHCTEDKAHWVEAFGPSAEWSVIHRLWAAGLRATLNPEKRDNAYAIDALLELPVDIKTVRTPFRTAARYGIPPEFAVTLNPRPTARYPNHALIVFDVDWQEQDGVPAQSGLYLVSVRELRSKQLPIHQYQRRVGDVVNNQDAYVLDLREMTCLT
jgi:hypothetical protein